mmetsp:Transcript_16402/g.40904  ORF Transcript_16402/g.40904 Transcript_16402/m.40904 type:complete len:231 (+) Transcript_16402:3994-4686(+)
MWKLEPASLYHIVLSLERMTSVSAPTHESGGMTMVARCSGTLAPAISTSHSASSQSRKSDSHAMWPLVCVRSGHSSSGGSTHSRDPVLHTPQCSTSGEAASEMKSTRTGASPCSCRTTTSISVLEPSAYVRRHLVEGSMANCCTRKSSGISGRTSTSRDSTGAGLAVLTRSSGLRLGALSDWPTWGGPAGALGGGGGSGAGAGLDAGAGELLPRSPWSMEDSEDMVHLGV